MRKTDGNIRKSYLHYKRDVGNPVVDVKDYIAINLKYITFLMGKVFEGHEITLPARMGFFMIRGKKRKIYFKEGGTPNLPVDFARTKKLWKECPECEKKKQILYHTNDHTDGVTYSFFWSKRGMFVVNKEFYTLKMVRANKRMVSKLVKQGKQYPIKLWKS